MTSLGHSRSELDEHADAVAGRAAAERVAAMGDFLRAEIAAGRLDVVQRERDLADVSHHAHDRERMPFDHQGRAGDPARRVAEQEHSEVGDVLRLLDALTPFGITNLEMPATPERVWRAIEEA